MPYTQIEKRLNLVLGSPSFVLRCMPDTSMEVLQIGEVPNDQYEYWVHATVTLACGDEADAVFCLASGGSEHVSIMFRVGNSWYASDSADLLDALGLSSQEVFPFDWEFSVPVANDIYHNS